MSGSNQFLPFAIGGGANTLTPAAYAALTTLLTNGFSAGTASSQQINTAFRQATFVAAALAQAIADQIGVAVADDGVVANFENQLLRMLQLTPYSISVVGGTADALTGAYNPAISALSNGMTLYVRAASANATTTPTFQANATAAKTIVKGNNLPLAAGDIAGAGHWIGLQYDQTLDKWVLRNPANGVNSSAVFASNAEAQALSITTKVISPATLAAALQGANQSLAASGYQKLPGGLIVQWGTFTASAGADTVVTYPVAFPTAAYSVVGTVGTGSQIVFVTNGTSTTAFNANAISSGGRNALSCSWIAFGK